MVALEDPLVYLPTSHKVRTMSDDGNKHILTEPDQSRLEGEGHNSGGASGTEPIEIEGASPLSNLTPDGIRNLQAKAAQAEQNWEKFLRISADFDNFKKRAARERQEAIKFAEQRVDEDLERR